MAQKTSELIHNSGDLTRTEFESLTSGKVDDYIARSSVPDQDADTGNDQTEHIKAQIEETRSQMGETIDALQERLSFSNISEQVSEHVNSAIETAKNSVYDATIGKAVGFMKNMGDGITDTKIVKTVRNNPLPLVVIGLGAGWLAYNSFAGSRRRQAGFRVDNFDRETDFDRVRTTDEQRSTLGALSEKASGLTDKVSGAANTAYEGVSNAMDTAVTGARDIANRAYSKAGEYGTSAYDTYDHYIEENPLAVGAAAFALGAVVGLAIPATRYEGELMGGARDELLRKAQDKGSMILDKTKNIVGEAADTVSKETRAIIH